MGHWLWAEIRRLGVIFFSVTPRVDYFSIPRAYKGAGGSGKSTCFPRGKDVEWKWKIR
jgi:hypothetical protein